MRQWDYRKLLIKSLSLDILKNHPATVLFIWVTVGFVASSQLLYTAFLFHGSFALVDLHLSQNRALLFDALLSILFFLQHSILIRKSVKTKLSRFVPNEYYGSFYGITTALVLFPVVLFWQKSSIVIGTAEGVSFWLLRAAFALSLLLFVWGVKSLGRYDASGVEPLLDAINNTQNEPYPFMVRGAYRWVRHPLYLCTFIFMWSCPILTLDRLLLNTLWSVYTVFGAILEERDLVKTFGRSYLQYKSQVPMLLPYRIPNNKIAQSRSIL